MSVDRLKLADVGVTPMPGRALFWLTPDEARALGFREDEIAKAIDAARAPPPPNVDREAVARVMKALSPVHGVGPQAADEEKS